MITSGAQAPFTDVELVHAMARGDEDAAHGLIEAHGDAVLRFVLRRTGGCVEDAEEVVQDSFVAAVRMAETYDGSCAVRTWLCSIAKLKIGDRVRSESRQKRTAEGPVLSLDDDSLGALRQVHDHTVSLDEIVDRLDRVHLVQVLLDSMSPDQREAVVLRYVEQFSIGEIARIMGRSEKAIERLLERAKERPRHEMFRWFGDESFRFMCFELLSL